MCLHNHLPRRSFNKLTLSIALASLLLPFPHAEPAVERRLNFFHTHTGKHLDVVYKRGSVHVPESLREINEFLSDFRTGEITRIDPHLLDFIYDLRESLGSNGTFEVISAYRSRQTNEMLRRRSTGVARNSQHLYGKAIDIRLTDVDLHSLRDKAIDLQRGGVGYYEESNFVHIDTGRVRHW